MYCWIIAALLIAQAPGGQLAPAGPAEAIATANERLSKEKGELSQKLYEANRDKEKAEAKYEDLSTGKFIESGVTGGVAVMLQSELSSGRDGIKQRTSEVTAMPYLLVLPGYWGNKPEVDKYCAGRFNAGAVDAQKAADSQALQRAEIPLKALLSAVEAGVPLEKVRDLLGAERLSETTYGLAEVYLKRAKSREPTPSDEFLRDLILRAVSSEALSWTPGIPPRAKYCAARKFGLWIGFPLNSFNARIESNAFGQSSDRERDVRPVFSFGLGIAPNAIITGLVGVSYAIVKLPNDPMMPDSTRPAGYWSFTAGIGGNLDIINLFRKK